MVKSIKPVFLVLFSYIKIFSVGINLLNDLKYYKMDS